MPYTCLPRSNLSFTYFLCTLLVVDWTGGLDSFGSLVERVDSGDALIHFMHSYHHSDFDTGNSGQLW